MTDGKSKIMFTVTERTKADFKLQLQYDSLTQVKFFRALMEGYVNKDPDLMVYINKFKKENSVQNNEQRKKIMTNIKKTTDTKSKFNLGDEEVENIFDILEKEHPDL
jgi:hypothetical protein|tara:strand:- start:6211 stop:6531 length:321 start_codon:yes stop_codon:yes gene_type:complete